MKYLILCAVLFTSVQALADCYERLTDGSSNDSRHFSFKIDEIYSENAEELSTRAIKAVYSMNNCGRPKFTEICCRRLGKRSWSKSCYVETEEGYFFVAEDMVQSVNVIFNRFD